MSSEFSLIPKPLENDGMGPWPGTVRGPFSNGTAAGPDTGVHFYVRLVGGGWWVSSALKKDEKLLRSEVEAYAKRVKYDMVNASARIPNKEAECASSDNAMHHYTRDIEYDESGASWSCEHCGEQRPKGYRPPVRGSVRGPYPVVDNAGQRVWQYAVMTADGWKLLRGPNHTLVNLREHARNLAARERSLKRQEAAKKE